MRIVMILGLALLVGGILEGSTWPLPPHFNRVPRSVQGRRECDRCNLEKEITRLSPVHGQLCRDCMKAVDAGLRRR